MGRENIRNASVCKALGKEVNRQEEWVQKEPRLNRIIHEKRRRIIMKRLLLPVLPLVFVIGMSSKAIAISDGTYDWYGTFSLDPRSADGNSTCTATDFGESCPLTVNFCITDLTVATNGGVQTITGPATAPYGINVGVITGLPITIAHVGDGQVDLTVGTAGDDVTTSISTDTVDTGGSCSGAAALVPCINSWGSNSPSSSGSPGAVVTGKIPMVDATRPTDGTACAGGSISYGQIEFTTETATAEATNESGPQSYSNPISGGLSGNSLIMSAPDAILRTTVGPVTLGTDQMVIMTFDGTLCDASGGSCAQSCP
jgi:hypothetical protein